MDDHISREKAIETVSTMALVVDERLMIIRRINALPSAQKKGVWQITEAYPHNVYCSECHTKFAQTDWAVWKDGSLPRKFCPNCGAKMRGNTND